MMPHAWQSDCVLERIAKRPGAWLNRGVTETGMEREVLAAAAWRGLAARHFERARRFTGPARGRRERGIPHPTMDFLFEYYAFSFSFLEQWHPGVGVALEWLPGDGGPEIPAGFPDRWYRAESGRVFADPGRMGEKETRRLEWIAELLEATAGRAPNFACHGLHEWAMVYQGLDVRHGHTLELRLPQAEIDAVVESRPVCCSHFDAFRFFAPAARLRNLLQPTLEGRILLEQPACLHANMDLFKWAAKSMPWVGSGLLMDCFELAVELRDLDMRASPYDLRCHGREPVRVETAEGRRRYEAEQREFAARAAPLRQRLIDAIRTTLALARAGQRSMI